MTKIKTIPGINTKSNEWLSELQNDNIYVESKIVDLASLTGMPVRKGLSKALISEGEIVNIISPAYGHMPNEKFFYEVEHKLIDAGIQYATRSINRDNKSFAVDYILSDESYQINVKNGIDQILPMMRFTNAYDGSGPCSGNFGFFRKVCENGLHVAQTKVGFKVRHKSTIHEIVLPRIEELVANFINNEYYSLQKKFEVLAERPLLDMNEFVKYTCTKLDLFKYEQSEKNPDLPGANARLVMESITREANLLGTDPTLWLGYNAFNEFLHASKKPFQRQKLLDSQLFNAVFEMATN